MKQLSQTTNAIRKRRLKQWRQEPHTEILRVPGSNSYVVLVRTEAVGFRDAELLERRIRNAIIAGPTPGRFLAGLAHPNMGRKQEEEQ